MLTIKVSWSEVSIWEIEFVASFEVKQELEPKGRDSYVL